jgi:hypothetical protein
MPPRNRRSGSEPEPGGDAARSVPGANSDEELDAKVAALKAGGAVLREFLQDGAAYYEATLSEPPQQPSVEG